MAFLDPDHLDPGSDRQYIGMAGPVTSGKTCPRHKVKFEGFGPTKNLPYFCRPYARGMGKDAQRWLRKGTVYK